MSSTFIHFSGFEGLGFWMILKLSGTGSVVLIWTKQ